jgi:pSer/pThr/pTyr-binding forkhead associated (FHA) protein
MRTQKMTVAAEPPNPERFFEEHRVTLLLVSGPSAGSGYADGEYLLEFDGMTIGRGPGVDIAIDDSRMSGKHAVLELTREGLRVRDLGSTNGIIVNGGRVQAWDLKSGDRFELGEHTFEYTEEPKQDLD